MVPHAQEVAMTAGPILLLAGSRRNAIAQLATGIVVGLLAVVVFAGSRFVAANSHHAYDPGARPPPSFAVAAGRTYQLSSAESVQRLTATGVLSNLGCTWSAVGRDDADQLPITSTLSDDRNLHTFALFAAPVTGSITIRCNGLDRVLVDDAEDSKPDYSALLMLISTGLALAGAVLAVAGGYAAVEEAATHRAGAERGAEAGIAS
jgi:hypothetical protein